jgi:hypothetical protein
VRTQQQQQQQQLQQQRGRRQMDFHVLRPCLF